MTTASMLLTVATTWNVSTDKIDKEGCLGVAIKHVTAEAAKEVRESPSTKEQALAIMREWIQQNIDIKNVRQGKTMNLSIGKLLYQVLLGKYKLAFQLATN